MRLLAFLIVVVFISCNDGVPKAPSNEPPNEPTEAPVPERKVFEGEKLYAIHCQSCHMDDGAGVPDMNAPLINSDYVKGNKDKLIHIVLEGTAALGTDATREYTNIMPGFPHLKDRQIADILTYLRNSFKNTGSAITEEEVSKIRAQIK